MSIQSRARFLWVPIATLTLGLTSPGTAQEAGLALRESVILVRATGSVTLEPDHAMIVFGVLTRDSRAERAAQMNAKLMAEVLDTLASLGFSRDSATTVRYTVRPVYENERERRRVVGHAAEAMRQVKVRDLASVGSVIDAVLARGANAVPSIRFGSVQESTARLEALRRAMEAARAEADAIAEAAGGRIGRLVEASTSPALRSLSNTAVVEALRVGTDIAPPALSVSATVAVRWEFVPER